MQGYKGHIGAREGSVLLFTVLGSMLFLQYPQYLVKVGGPAAWQVALLVTLFGMLFALPIVALGRRFPGHGLAEISLEAAGPVVGPLLTLVVAVWLAAVTAVSLRNFTETFVITILPDTPPSVLVLTGTVLAVFTAYHGAETVARASYVLLPLIAAGVLLVLLFSLPRVDTSLLFPFWGYGLDRTVTGALYYASMSAEVIVLLAMGHAFRDARSLQHSSLRGILLFGVAATLTVVVLVGIAGTPLARQDPFPLYYLARLVYLGRFLQRTEALIVMFWILAAAVRVSALMYATAISLTGALRLPDYRPVLFPLATILTALSLLPKDYVSVLILDRDWVRPLGFAVLAVPLLLWVVALIRRKGAAANAS